MNLLKLVRTLKAFARLIDETGGTPDWVRPRVFIDGIELEYTEGSVKFEADPWAGMITPPTFCFKKADGTEVNLSTTNITLAEPPNAPAQLYLEIG